ncbi:unnamed protein product [Chrysoparadoxa australica]
MLAKYITALLLVLPPTLGMLPTPQVAQRVQLADPAYIEVVLSKYADLPDAYTLAQGVSHWKPPDFALQTLETAGRDGVHLYGPCLGTPELRTAIKQRLVKGGLAMSGQEVMVCAGANQAFATAALCVLDPGDRVLLPKPYYCSHQSALQLAGASITHIKPDPASLLPCMEEMEKEFKRLPAPKALIVTTPCNPSGAVYPKALIERLVGLCKQHGTWLIIDEAYEDFIYDGESAYSPCSANLDYEGIIHIWTMSKAFGMAGWRVGYMLMPQAISDDMVKIQDTIPTHACLQSQRLAAAALTHSGSDDWVKERVLSLRESRQIMWEAVKGTGAVKGNGSFYFLVPLPGKLSEDDAIDVLARKFGVIVTPGTAFGAPGHARISYGSQPPKQCKEAADRLKRGLDYLAFLDTALT